MHAELYESPLNPSDCCYIPIDNGCTIDEFLKANNLHTRMQQQPIIVELNRKELLASEYDYRLKSDDNLVLRTMPQADPVTWGYIIFAVVAYVYADSLIESIPESPAVAGINDPGAASPTYNVNARQNQARIGQPKSVVCGRNRVYPSLAAKVYSEIDTEGNQVAFLLMDVAINPCEVYLDTAKFEDTLLSDFADFDVELLQPGEQSSFYTNQVVTSSEVSNFKVGGQTIISSYVVNDVGTSCIGIGVDFSSAPSARNSTTGEFYRARIQLSVRARRINDAGDPLGFWQNLGLVLHSGDRGDSVRTSHYFVVAAGRYEVSVSRLTEDSDSVLVNDDIFWFQLRGYLQNDAAATDTTRLALRIRASESIGNAALSKFNVEVAGKVREWSEADGWSDYIVSDNPAWVAADILTASYGGERSEGFIDLLSLAAAAEKHRQAGHSFNGVFDTLSDCFSALNLVGAACFARPIPRAGVIHWVLDERQEHSAFKYTMRNIKKGSFSIQNIAITEGSVDYFIVKYFDASQGYREQAIECALPGSAKKYKKEISLFGVDNAEQAYEIGLRMALKQQYRRRRVSFTTGIEGRIPFYGQKILVSHYMVGVEGAKQYSADVISVLNDVIRLNVSPAGLDSPYIVISDQYGVPSVHPCEVTGDSVRVLTAFDASGLVLDGRERPQVAIGDGMEFCEAVKIDNIKALENNEVQLQGFIENELVYSPDLSNVPALTDLPPVVSILPVVDDVVISLTNTRQSPVIYLSWTQKNIDYVRVELKDDDDEWVLIKRVYDNSFEFLVSPGLHEVRLTPVNILYAKPLLFTVDASSDSNLWLTSVDQPPARPVGFDAVVRRETGIYLSKEPSSNLDYKETAFFVGSNFSDATELGRGHTTSLLIDKTLSGLLQLWCVDVDNGGNVSEPAAASITINAPSSPAPSIKFVGDTVVINWAQSSSDFLIDFYRISYEGDTLFESDATQASIGIDWSGSRIFSLSVYDIVGNKSDDVSIEVVVENPLNPNANFEYRGSDVRIFWQNSAGTLPVDYYEIKENGEVIDQTDSNAFLIPLDTAGDHSFSVVAVDVAKNRGDESFVAVSPMPPELPQVQYRFDGKRVVFEFEVVAGDLPLGQYAILRDGVVIAQTSSSSWLLDVDWQGNEIFGFSCSDSAGNESGIADVNVIVGLPSSLEGSLSYSGTQAILKWSVPSSDLPIEQYIVETDEGVVAELTQTSFSFVVDFAGSKDFTIAGVDSAGNKSPELLISVSPVPPGISSLSNEVIDNNVLFRYSANKNSLPIESFSLRRGSVFDTANAFAVKAGNSTFTTLFETTAGAYTYWIYAIDSAGNEGQAISTTATVSQPPDYVLFATYSEREQGWQGVKNNCVVSGANTLLAPVDADETWHDYIDNGYDTLQQEVGAGYTVFSTPAPSNARYEKIIDYGAELSGSLITLSLTPDAISGSVVTTARMGYSTDNINWVDGEIDQFQLFGVNFRYVRYEIDFVADGNDLIEMEDIQIRLDKKLRSDVGRASSLAGDANGTRVDFNVDFIDIAAINVTAAGSVSVNAIYDFVDVPNPTHFFVYLFDQQGNRVSGDFSWRAEGY